MEYFFLIVIFIFGTFIGSFLGVLVDRLSKGESIVFGRSHCDHCRHKLLWRDLVPVLSYAILGGKCRYCQKPISTFYPIIEITTGFTFVLLTLLLVGTNNFFLLSESRYILALIYFAILFSGFIVIFFSDLRYGIIPFPVVFFSFFSTVVWFLLLPFSFTPSDPVFFPTDVGFLVSALLSAIGAFLIFLFLYLITRGKGMGFGDVVYVFLMGFVLGYPRILLELYIAFLSGAIISLLLVATGKKKMRGETTPFGPFLVSGTIISLLWGEQIIAAVMGYLI